MPNFCINCGGRNIEEATEHKDVVVERGEYEESDGSYSLESNQVVLKCQDCEHEMIDLSA
ncbi:hypothetical protein P3447_08090 [Vibrio parahaemolyticus]|nr:hypothetical protein [Vibrio parahaemolyticus]